jgi:NADH-quinone oxidoreductase subunit E
METVINNREQLIPLLQEVQRKEGYISQKATARIADQLKIAESEVFGVASFYAQFKFNPPGKNAVRVCLGTACHVRGGQVLLSALERDLGIGPGQTTQDRQFDLDRVACLGCCALAPVVTVNEDILGQVNPNKLSSAIRRVSKKKTQASVEKREGDPSDDGKE